MSNKRERIDVLEGIANETEKLIEALNSVTGYTTESPNPLTVRASRLLNEARENNYE